LGGIEDELSKVGRQIIIMSCDDERKIEKDNFQALYRREVEGIIVFPVAEEDGLENSTEYYNELIKRNIHLVMIDRYLPEIDCDRILIEDEKSTFECVGKLLDSGVKKIGFVGQESHSTSVIDRFRGYQNALANAGIPFDESCVYYASKERCLTPKVLEKMISEIECDALFFTSAGLAMQILPVLRKLKKEGLPLAFFSSDGDNLDVFQNYVTVKHAHYNLGACAARQLLKRIDGDESSSANIVLPTRVINHIESFQVTGGV
jgi:LacI family transcriptional regulator